MVGGWGLGGGVLFKTLIIPAMVLLTKQHHCLEFKMFRDICRVKQQQKKTTKKDVVKTKQLPFYLNSSLYKLRKYKIL